MASAARGPRFPRGTKSSKPVAGPGESGTGQMARIDRYLLTQLMVLFGFFSLVLVLVYWVNRAVILFDQLIADGQSAGVFLEFTAMSLPNVIRLVLPIAAFAASVYVTNRLATESELTVMQATGHSVWRLARPVLWFGLVVAGLMTVLLHLLVPLSQQQLAKREAEIAENVTARLLTEGTFLDPAPGITFYIRDISPSGKLNDIFLHDAREPDQPVTYTASSAFLLRGESGPQLVMLSGMAQTLDSRTGRLSTTTFEDFAYDIGGLIGRRDPGIEDPAQLWTLPLLRPGPEEIARTGVSAAALVLEGHGRFVQALLAVVAALLGFSTLVTGGYSRFGIWRQIIWAIALLILIKTVESVVLGAIAGQRWLWPLAYTPVILGLLIAWAQLASVSRTPRRARRALA